MHAAILLPLTLALGQHPHAPDVRAVRVAEPPDVDGRLVEQIWQGPPAASSFTQRDPDEGKPATERTEVWVAYDDRALYVAARLYDSEPDKVAARLGRRDDYIESDWFSIGIDSYHDHRTAFQFEVNPAGVRSDGTTSETGFGDDSWDAVWAAAARRDSAGWTAEIEIPFSQLRFTRADTLVWGINLARQIQRKREFDVYAFVPKGEAASISRYAHLVGLVGIRPPRRIELLPYSTARGEYVTPGDPDDPFNDGSRYFSGVGLDGKIGIGSDFTLDLTVNPDFGQVEQDPAFVNLSAFEQFLQERRPFFIEGSNIFDFGTFRGGGLFFGFGSDQFFYSRRIGRPPQRFVFEPDGFADTPRESTIVGAAKLTGKTTSGWSVGLLEAVTAEEHAEVIDSVGNRREEAVEPLTNTFVGRLIRDLRGGAWSVGGLVTAVNRRLEEPELENLLRSAAYGGGLDWILRFADRRYSVSGLFALSRIQGEPSVITAAQRSSARYYQRPDAGHVELDSARTSLTGAAGRLRLGKDAGEHWLYSVQADFMTPGFETSDAGFMFRADRANLYSALSYQRLRPGRVFRFLRLNTFGILGWNFDGDPLTRVVRAFGFAQFLNYWSVNFGGGYSFETVSDGRTRGGPLMADLPGRDVNFGVSSDSRKPVNGSVNVWGSRDEADSWNVGFFSFISLRPSPNLELRLTPSFSRWVNDAQWITNWRDSLASATFGVRHIFGRLDQRILEMTARATWTFKPDLTFQLFLQPFVASIDYLNFKELARPASYDFLVYGEGGSTLTPDATGRSFTVDPDGEGAAPPFTLFNPDFKMRSLRGTAVLRWEYRPGSTLFLVWQQSRFGNAPTPGLDGPGDLGGAFDLRPDNVFQVKLNYWLSL